MISVRFKAIAGKYTILKPFFIAYIPFIMVLFLRKDFHPIISCIILLSVWKLLLYFVFSMYYVFSYEKNVLIIKKKNKLWKQIPIQDISRIVYSYEWKYHSSSLVFYINKKEIFLLIGGIATEKIDSIKARHLITRRLKPILLENDFQEKITEKEKKIIFEYVKK